MGFYLSKSIEKLIEEFKFPYYIRSKKVRDLITELCKYDKNIQEKIESGERYIITINMEDLHKFYPMDRPELLRYKPLINYLDSYLNIELRVITRIRKLKDTEIINLIEIN